MADKEALRQLRRSQIIDVARKLVATEGLSALTIGALEERLDFSRGVITYHFQNKDEIVYAVLGSAITQLDGVVLARVAQSAAPRERIFAVMDGMVRGFVESHREAGNILLAFTEPAGGDPRAAEITRNLYARYRAQSLRLLHEVCAPARPTHHGGDAPADLAAIATLMVSMVIGVATQATFAREAVPIAEAIEEACQMLYARLGI